jgi:putative oxidoreductase
MPAMKQLAHLLLSVTFILGGSRAFLQPGDRVKKVANVGIPEPELAVKVNGASMVLGGVALGLGILPRLTAAMLIIALIPTTIVGHAFWKEETEAGKKNQQIQFAKNLSIIGGLLLVLAEGKEKSA